jgi:hypothetical protein
MILLFLLSLTVNVRQSNLKFTEPRAMILVMRRTLTSLAVCLLVIVAMPLSAASTGQAALHMPQGSAATTPNGDWVSDSTALNTFYRYFIEVVPGTPRLTVEIFDADVGRGANEDDAGRDRDRGGGFSTTATYTLLRPDGTTAATLGPCDSASAACADNAWTVLLNSNTAQNTAVGHWELRVDTNGGNDINAIGIRAHDGTSGAGGTVELNVYADSMISMGINPNPNAATRTYTIYPWITSGCQCSQNDFDRDRNQGNTGSVTYTSRTGAFTQTFASTVLSIDNTWAQNQLNRWGDDDESDDYGIWTWQPTINTYNNGAQNGNYETAYVGSYLAPNANPTSNPILSGGVPATFRLYLPTDAGVAPVKPYLQQLLTQNRNFSGPNPTQVGQTTTFTVTIRVTNPTPFPITFNAANLVSTNIPGGTVVYGGNAAVSQGSIVTQPTVGAAAGGNLTWNPTVVAAKVGAVDGFALLSYDVRVTPTVAGQRNLATPAPATATSTRAQYIDETGNTTQPRARYIMGGLCELAVTQGLVTEVMLSSFDSDRGRVRWTTSSEAGTIGFNLYRKDGSRVNESLIPAGRHNYEIDDRFGGSEYILEEVMASGRTRQMGPMISHHRLGPDVAEPVAQPRQFFATAEARFETDAVKADAVMVGVRETGLVRVPFSELASRFGKAAPAIDNAARKGSLSVKNNGQPVAYTSTNDAIIFFGEKSDSIYSNERVYRIDEAQGVRMASLAVPAASAAVSTFNTRTDFETDALPATVLPLDPDGDYWFWDFVLSGDPDYGRRPFTLNVPVVSSTSGVQLEVRLQGALAGANHRARVSLNGVPVGDLQWKSIDPKTAYINIPSGVLRDGANELFVEGTLESGAAFDVFYVDGFAVRYDRAARPVNGALEASTKGAFVAGPFTAQPMTVDVTNRLRPAIVTGGSYNRGNVSMVLPAAVKTVFLAQQFVTPASYRSSSASTALRSQRADYVVIAPQSMRSGAEALASLRQRDGLQTFVADLEQVYDEFSNGNVTPNAIRSFIGTATTKWSLKPKYVVLAGSGTLDYRGIIGAPGPVPPMMMQTQDGLFASDTRLADANGNGLPDAAIGRIPVANNTDLLAYVRKLRDHSGAADTQPMVFSADAADSMANFAADSALAAQPLQSRPKVSVNVDELGAQGARNALISNWQAGPGLVSWVGHGGFDQISSSGILTAGDVPSLRAQGRLPVMVAMTCTINRFEVPYSEPLGAALARDADGGALAVWSATGLSVHASAREMQQTFMRLAADKPQSRIGDLVMQTLALHPSDTAGIYLLLGDPAVALALPKEAVHGITPSTPGE